MNVLRASIVALACQWLAAASHAAAPDIPKAPVPKSPYMPVIYRYADTLIEKARDSFGPSKTGLFLSALDRERLAPLTNRPAAPAGVREDDRAGTGPLTGANPQHDENLLRLLLTLSELSNKPKYRDAADAELKWFLENTASPKTHLLPWGKHLSWDVMTDAPNRAGADALHEFFRPWMLWDRCFDLAPDASRRFALGLWEHQIANPATGAFDRQAGFDVHAPRETMDFPRHAGFYIRTWAVAYARTHDEQFLKSIEVLLRRFEQKRHPTSGWIEAWTGHSNAWTTSTLSLAIDCDGASHRVPAPLAIRLRAFAEREDGLFCNLPHPLKRADGFLTTVDRATGRANAPTPLWNAQYGAPTTAQIGLMCVSRFDNSGNPAWRRLILGAAEQYHDAPPPGSEDLWPATLGQAISLQVAAWRHSAAPRHLERARQLADFAVEKFWGTNALPRASLQTHHYEAITGADTLALALLELHLHILHITAVRCPPNTIDR